MTELATREFSTDQIDLIRRTVANGATNDELRLFLYQAQRTGLDPLARQIHFVKRKSKDGPARAAIQTGIDGYRLIADRTGKYAGNDDPEFSEVTESDDGTQYPLRATVCVWKVVNSERCPFTATARWQEYYPGDGKPGFMWRKMPFLMLGKTAEALALRKAFPAELSGLYTEEEMDQAGEVEPAQDPDTDWSAGSVATTADPTASEVSPSSSAQDVAPSTTASTGAGEPSVAPSASAPGLADLWDRIDQAVQANLIRKNLVTLKASRIAMAADVPIPEQGFKYDDVGKLRPDLLKALADDLDLDAKVPA